MTCDVTCWTCDALTVSLAYAYDALSRPISRNADTFAYNVRGEVVSATVGGNGEAHSYDHIGNAVLAASGGVTNAYAANSLNQYTQVGRAAPCPPTPDGGLGQAAPPVTPTYDADGNLTAFGPWDYTYDAANRLKTASSNGVLIVTNFYDAKSRRVKKVTQEATMTFFYDGWNLVEERIAYTNGISSTIHYYWGKDLSGALQGAGGVGGLLYLTIDGVPYVPNYDNIGNITRYLDLNGNTVAQYTYDAFGGTLSQSGSLSTFFRHRFSTKYLDVETGLYYYGYRFYSPLLMRWLTRDPLEEKGGINLYAFCGNNSVCNHDKDGCAYFIKRSMFGLMYQTAQRDIDNQEWAHEQLIFEDGKSPKDVGYFGDSTVKEDPGWEKSRTWVRVPGHYNDCVMRKALESVQPRKYKMRGEGHYNCQDYADDLRARYGVLIRDKRVRCECGLSK